MIEHPRISVIIPFWNAGEFLREAIDSVIAQTFGDWELLLVDDGSTDESSDIARRCAELHPQRVRYLEHPGHVNRGLPASRNFALQNARAEYVALLDSDDVWLPHKLDRQLAILSSRPECGMVFGRALYWSGWTGRANDIRRDFVADLGFPGDVLFQPPQLVRLCYPLGKGSAPCPSDLLVRRALLERLGGFEEAFSGEYMMYEDQALLVKIYLQAPVFVANECWFRYRVHAKSISARTMKSGEYHRVRGFFLAWLSEYLREQRITHLEVRDALRRALWLYRHPRQAYLIGGILRVIRRVSSPKREPPPPHV